MLSRNGRSSWRSMIFFATSTDSNSTKQAGLPGTAERLVNAFGMCERMMLGRRTLAHGADLGMLAEQRPHALLNSPISFGGPITDEDGLLWLPETSEGSVPYP